MNIKILGICLLSLFSLTACGSEDSGKVSKGHRDAIHIECSDDPDKKLCGREVRSAFIEDGNELNRIVEFPVESLIEDFSKILKKLPYEDSYADF